jgi:hypothetical protein
VRVIGAPTTIRGSPSILGVQILLQMDINMVAILLERSMYMTYYSPSQWGGETVGIGISVHTAVSEWCPQHSPGIGYKMVYYSP